MLGVYISTRELGMDDSKKSFTIMFDLCFFGIFIGDEELDLPSLYWISLISV